MRMRTMSLLRLAPGIAFAAAVAFAASGPLGCSNADAPAADLCIQAKDRFASCGTSLPLLSDGPCAGTSRIVARCVVDHARDCDELASLFGRIDACVADLLDGGDDLLPPPSDLPVPPRDGGADAGDVEPFRDVDAAPRPVEGGSSGATDGGASDSGTESGR
ncbi:MAG: hypothetical protein NVS3B10_31770 [Polyangiales bacterium]